MIINKDSFGYRMSRPIDLTKGLAGVYFGEVNGADALILDSIAAKNPGMEIRYVYEGPYCFATVLYEDQAILNWAKYLIAQRRKDAAKLENLLAADV